MNKRKLIQFIKINDVVMYVGTVGCYVFLLDMAFDFMEIPSLAVAFVLITTSISVLFKTRLAAKLKGYEKSSD
ncbi:hypothetical protein DN752_16865 [Echinicola strongylocentroti]|uniref:Uncharacterized protein n=1 Tax=Echinicola strongylocentroti TaxID=1795355 RepID=A0A2Z4IMQ0_9BACT|nr:hypothetical protein [Echinicola strongylocentroti]AWW31663.1 hypothetical protein DN752_16865 [Echinicola strongylocentroti]